MRTILSFIAAGALALLLLGGCGRDDAPSGAAVAVVATTPQAADFVREVGGDRVAVDQVLAPNADPHEYEPRPSDAEALAGADLVVRSGGDLDGWLDQLVESSGADAPVLTLIDSVRTRPAEDGETDPHWWQDPRNAILAVAAIRDELSAVDPAGAAAYERRAAEYTGRLERLDREIARCVDAVPAEERLLVTSHDSLGYYADRYGIEVIGATIPSLSTQAQPSAGDTADLIELIRRTGARAIFPEAGVSEELERSIASEAGATVGGELWADTLGPEGSPAATYIGAQESNTRELVAGFTGGSRRCDFGG
jgi:ABC-type Zn uptake system ZnuABC Zn-binding protein ZnuA